MLQPARRVEKLVAIDVCVTGYLSGARPVNALTQLDLLGIARPVAAQWVVPQRVDRNPGCVTCAQAGVGDAIALGRYATDPQR